MRVHAGPGNNAIGEDNFEGFAITPSQDCASPYRRAFLTIDGGRGWSLYAYNELPCSL